MQTITLTALVAFGLATPAMAAATVPEEYQGVWAKARDCKENFQKRTFECRKSGIRRLSHNADLKFRSSGIAHEHHLSELRGFAEPRDLA